MNTILKKHKNEIIEVIKKNNLNPLDFLVDEHKGQGSFKLTFKDSNLSFSFLMSSKAYDSFLFSYNEFTPNRNLVKQHERFQHFVDVLARFNNWIINHINTYIEDTNTPDPWEEYSKYFNSGGEDDDSLFTTVEKERIKQSIITFRKAVLERLSLQEEQIKTLDTKLNRLLINAEKQTKSDWLLFALSVLVNIVTALSLSPQQGHEIMNLFKESFQYIKSLIPHIPNHP